jgi:hypothetical protein
MWGCTDKQKGDLISVHFIFQKKERSLKMKQERNTSTRERAWVGMTNRVKML